MCLGLLGGCDPGLVTFSPAPLAVGSSTRVTFMDFCTKDGKEHTTPLYPMFSVRGRSVGTCTVEVRDESARWVTELQLNVW